MSGTYAPPGGRGWSRGHVGSHRRRRAGAAYPARRRAAYARAARSSSSRARASRSPTPGRSGAQWRFGRALIDRAPQPAREIRIRTAVVDLEPAGEGWARVLVAVPRPARCSVARVIVAPGAHDRPVVFPGWTLPGVITAGGTPDAGEDPTASPGPAHGVRRVRPGGAGLPRAARRVRGRHRRRAGGRAGPRGPATSATILARGPGQRRPAPGRGEYRAQLLRASGPAAVPPHRGPRRRRPQGRAGGARRGRWRLAGRCPAPRSRSTPTCSASNTMS